MLSLSTKYGFRALVYLAVRPPEQFISVEELALRSEVPAPYLAKVMKVLARRGIVESKRGPQGGVRLGRESVTLYEVCEALDDPVAVERCLLSNQRCQPLQPCPMHERWEAERQRITQFLNDTVITRKTELP